MRIAFPIAAVGFATLAEERGWGLLNQVDLPLWLRMAAAMILLDLAIYAQHVLFHAAAPLWRLHRVHHADLDVDVTTGARFHPLEILLSMAIKVAVVITLGAPAVAVMLFEVFLNALSMFNHANIKLSQPVDRFLRSVLVTPDMHRVHHSVRPHETNSNFGFQLALWDRLFGTYRADPEDSHEDMTLGLPVLRDPAELRLDHMLLQPFRAPERRS